MTLAPFPPQKFKGNMKVIVAPYSHCAIMFSSPLLIPGIYIIKYISTTN